MLQQLEMPRHLVDQLDRTSVTSKCADQGEMQDVKTDINHQLGLLVFLGHSRSRIIHHFRLAEKESREESFEKRHSRSDPQHSLAPRSDLRPPGITDHLRTHPQRPGGPL